MPVIINEVEVLEPTAAAAASAAGGGTSAPPAPAISADAIRRILDDGAGRRARRDAD